jgi:predicted nucleotidyltransferase component of viral defense system
MLNRDEIERIAKDKNEPAKITEKDYLLEIVLFLLQAHGKDLVFKGGTALYKLYSLNRFSEDLDFTLHGKINTEKAINDVMKKLERAGINGRIKEISSYRNQENIHLELRGPLFDGNPQNATIIAINISMKEKPLYEAKEEYIYPKYRDIPAFNVFVMPLNEILAEKIRALFTRDKPRDVYDIWFLLKKGVHVTLADVNKKLKLHNERFTREKFIEKIEDRRKSFDIDLRALIKTKLPDFNSVKEDLIENINSLIR